MLRRLSKCFQELPLQALWKAQVQDCGKRNKYEFDIYAEGVHYTEVDFKGLSKVIEELNKKWGTDVTYCLFPSSKYPNNILINVRSPKAPAALRV